VQLCDILTSGMDRDAFFAYRQETFRGLPLREIADFITEKYPAQRELILQAADLALAGMLVLPGTKNHPFFVGTPPPLWNENLGQDNEYVWGLNRMQHWKPLMQAYLFTGERRYADKVIAEFEDFVATCRPPEITDDIAQMGAVFNQVIPWRSLETGMRMYDTWSRLFEWLFAAGLMTAELLEKFTLSAYEHGRVLRNVCPKLFPKADHNHYYMETLGLFHVACTFPELQDASEWLTHSMGELERCAAAQFSADGGQIEGCPHYHNICFNLLRISVTSAQKFGHVFSDDYIATSKKAADYALYVQRPSGTIVPWGDSDADTTSIRSVVDCFLIDGDKRRLNILLGQGCASEIEKTLIENIWELPQIYTLLSDTNFFTYDAAMPTLPTVNLQRGLNQAALRTDWSKEALSVFFACNMPVNNGHAHIDPMGFDFTANGKPLLVDPGRFCYREDADRRKYKSPRWHNVLTVNDKDPFAYISTWAYGPQKPGRVVRLFDGDGFLAAEAESFAYDPVLHRRAVVLLDGRFLLVLDRLDGLQPDDRVQMYYHMDTTDALLMDRSCCKAPGLSLFYPPEMKAELLPGSVSDGYDEERASTRLCLHDVSRKEKVQVYATVCAPFDCLGAVKAEYLADRDTVQCEITIDGKQYVFCFA